MSDTAVAPPPAPASERRGPPAGPRQVRRRQPLPSGRAVVGGFLVALSALGIFVAWSTATEGPTRRYLVARHDLAIGSRVGPDDVTLVAMDLPGALARTAAFTDAKEIAGATVIGPVRKGELVQAGDLVASDTAPKELEVSFSIDASRAVGGSLRTGEFVDVLATFGAGGETYTTTVIQGARVLDVDERGSSLRSDDSRTVTLAVANEVEARAVVHAINAGDVVLVRSAGPGDKAEQGGVYRAPSARSSSTSGTSPPTDQGA